MELTYRNEVAIITVRDTGMGIAPENIQKINRIYLVLYLAV